MTAGQNILFITVNEYISNIARVFVCEIGHFALVAQIYLAISKVAISEYGTHRQTF